MCTYVSLSVYERVYAWTRISVYLVCACVYLCFYLYQVSVRTCLSFSVYVYACFSSCLSVLGECMCLITRPCQRVPVYIYLCLC